MFQSGSGKSALYGFLRQAVVDGSQGIQCRLLIPGQSLDASNIEAFVMDVLDSLVAGGLERD
jgi:hypothetical protein